MSNGTGQPEAIEFANIPSAEELALMKEQAQNPDPAPANDDSSADEAVRKDELVVPEKFQGKSVEQILESYSHLESQLGRQGQEISSLRSLNDQLLELKTTPPAAPAPAPAELTADDVLNNPNDAILAGAAPAFEATNSRVDALEAKLSLNAFERAHPTYLTDQQDPEFQAFVSQSPYRRKLAENLVTAGDLGAGDELWTAWEEHRSTPAAATEHQPTAEEIDAQETATAMTTRGGGDETGQEPKPISRQELANIRITDEERYYSPDFQAYVQYMYRNKLVK